MITTLIVIGIIWAIGSIVVACKQNESIEGFNFFEIFFWPVAAFRRICRDFDSWENK